MARIRETLQRGGWVQFNLTFSNSRSFHNASEIENATGGLVSKSSQSNISKRSRARIDDDRLKSLLASISEGDRVAFKEFYELTSGPCFAIVVRLLQDAEEAQNVLQKAYVSIWKNAGRYDRNKGKAFTWIVVIMRNRALDALRARALAPQTELLDSALIDPSQQTESRAEAFLLSRQLQSALNDLPSHISTAIQMNVIEGYSSTEIGELLDVSRHTVKTWIRRGLEKMRYQLNIKTFNEAL